MKPLSHQAVFAITSLLLLTPASAQINKVSGAAIAGGSVSTMAVTSTGSVAVFRSNREDAGRFDLWRGDNASAAPVKLSGSMVSGSNVRPDFLISGDASRAVFRADRVSAGDVGLWSASLIGNAGTPTDLAQLPAGRTVFEGFAVTSGGGTQRAVFVSNRDTATVRDLWAANLDGSGAPVKLSNLTSNAARDVQAFAISPNNAKVAFNGDLGVDGRDSLYVTDITGGAPLLLYAAGAGENVLNTIQFSTDGSLVVFRLDRGAAGVELLRVPVVGGSAVSLSGAVAGGRRVRGFRIDSTTVLNSQKVVFIADLTTTGKDELYSVDLDTASPVPINLSAPLATADAVASFKLSDEFDRVAFDTVDGGGKRRLWSTRVISSGGADTPADISGPMASGGDVTAYEIERQANYILFVASKSSAAVRELWSAPADGSGAAQKLSGALTSGGNVGNDIAIVPGGSFDTVLYRADAINDDKTELWRVLPTGGPAARLSGEMPAFADVAAFAFGGGSVYFLANREVATQQELFVNALRQTLAFDLDGDGRMLATTDALMVSRYLLGSRGNSISPDAVGAQPLVRQTYEIDRHLRRLSTMPAP